MPVRIHPCACAAAAVLALLAALVAVAAAPAPASAARYLDIRGAGFGHGVGMSQYGAYGLARHGASYRTILRHYYTGTELGRARRGQRVRVLLQTNRSSLRVRGATRAGGVRLSAHRTYTARLAGAGRVRLTYGSRTVVTTFGALRLTGGAATLQLSGTALNGVANGRYRGTLVLRPAAFGGLNAIDDLALDDYVRGVVPGEMPTSWRFAALQAQAVAARTYAITTHASSSGGFDQYPDTRSQVFRGVAGEDARGNAAVRTTAGQVVTYRGKPATTFFFSTSGGRTENVENAFPGSPAEPWLVSVDDPYDDISPRHRWVVRMTVARASALLGSHLRGRLRGIRVLRRGRSPRVLTAEVIGTRGRTRVTGSQLRSLLGLDDTWMRFSLSSSARPPRPLPELRSRASTPPPEPAGGSESGGQTSGGGGGQTSGADSGGSASDSGGSAAA